jgi:hypothetical protein
VVVLPHHPCDGNSRRRCGVVNTVEQEVASAETWVSPSNSDVPTGYLSTDLARGGIGASSLSIGDTTRRTWVARGDRRPNPLTLHALALTNPSGTSEDQYLGLSALGDTRLGVGVLLPLFAGRICNPHRDGLARQTRHGEGTNALLLEIHIGVEEMHPVVAIAPNGSESLGPSPRELGRCSTGTLYGFVGELTGG